MFFKCFILVPPETISISGEPSVPVDKTFVYRCEARNANPAPQIQWVVNNDVIDVNNNLMSASQPKLYGDSLQHRSATNSGRHSASNNGVQVTTQIHPPPSISMSSGGYGSGSLQVGYKKSIYISSHELLHYRH